MTQIVYSREAVALSEGQAFQNPRFFTGPVAGAESVVVHGDWPDIVAAYVVSGVEVTVVNLTAPPITHEPAPGDFGPLAQAFASADALGVPIEAFQTEYMVTSETSSDDLTPRRTRKPK